MDKYTLPLGLRKQTVQTQIEEYQRLIYRNNIENLSFIAENNKHKQVEVKTNNEMHQEKLDLLFEELERLNNETGSSTT